MNLELCDKLKGLCQTLLINVKDIRQSCLDQDKKNFTKPAQQLAQVTIGINKLVGAIQDSANDEQFDFAELLSTTCDKLISQGKREISFQNFSDIYPFSVTDYVKLSLAMLENPMDFMTQQKQNNILRTIVTCVPEVVNLLRKLQHV